MTFIPLIAVTMGDPGGVGPEITLKAVYALRSKARFLLIGKTDVFEKANTLLKYPLRFDVFHSIDSLPAARSSRIPTLDPFPAHLRFKPGRKASVNGMLAYVSLNEGAKLALGGYVSALVTAPLSKFAIQKTYRNFTDQTNFLTRFAKSKQTAMCFAQGKKCVTVVTTHVPVRKIASSLTRDDIVGKAKLTAKFLMKAHGIKRPRLAVLGLNPHAGEGGMLGREERSIIAPAVRILKKSGINAYGPLPADSAFHQWHTGRYDGAIAMYHDQGLAPFKMLYFHSGVHLTLGLPFIRTSPDHGTAFSLAYTGKARSDAMCAAVEMAISLARL